ncbi:unnamed protein product [Lampetra fluviatilis]
MPQRRRNAAFRSSSRDDANLIQPPRWTTLHHPHSLPPHGERGFAHEAVGSDGAAGAVAAAAAAAVVVAVMGSCGQQQQHQTRLDPLGARADWSSREPRGWGGACADQSVGERALPSVKCLRRGKKVGGGWRG